MDNSRQSRLLEQSRLNQSMPPPTDEQQLTFLAMIQRFFAEGDFISTYKYALLIAQADLAVELGARRSR